MRDRPGDGSLAREPQACYLRPEGSHSGQLFEIVKNFRSRPSCVAQLERPMLGFARRPRFFKDEY
jgi:hypothetical protein